MRHYLPNDLVAILDIAAEQIKEAKQLILKSEAGAMNAARSGALANEANAIGIAGYKQAGRLAFRAIQTIMYTQKGHISAYNMDLKDSTDTCANVFGSLESEGFLYPRFAKIGCPKQFTKYTAAVVDKTNFPDANLPSVETANYLLFTALKHGDYDQREVYRGTSATQNPNPFESIHALLTGSTGPIVQIFECDAFGEDGTTATPGDLNGVLDTIGDIRGGDIYGRAIYDALGTPPRYSYFADSSAAAKNYYIVQPFVRHGGAHVKAEAWHAGEWWLAISLDPGGSAKFDDTGAATQKVYAAEELLIRTIADQQSDLGTPTIYNPST